MNLLLVSPNKISDNALTGRELLADLNAKSLCEIFGPTVFKFCIDLKKKKGGLWGMFASLMGWLDGLSPEVERLCLETIRSKTIDIVYIEGSNYGRLARFIKSHVPNCKVVTFFHNVESRFFWGAFKVNPSIKSAGVLLANWLAERWAVRFSDRIICLNNRDSTLLRRIYGRGASDIQPLCVDVATTPEYNRTDLKLGLFVGGSFYANLQGARWFAREVAPKLSCQIAIVGNGFEKYRAELESNPNISVVGTVDSVSDWYIRATFVVAPIFDGSGMKTKVAEALMFGKPIVGTSEAFMGYEAVAEIAGIVCQDAPGFVSAINKICDGRRTFDSHKLRTLFDENYSFNAKCRGFESTFKSLGAL